jgi:hypothetical protein
VKQTLPYGLNEGEAAIRIPELAPALNPTGDDAIDRDDTRYQIPSDEGFVRNAWTDEVIPAQRGLAPFNPARLENEFQRRLLVAKNPTVRFMAMYANKTQTDVRAYVQMESIANVARVERESRAGLDAQRKTLTIAAQDRMAELNNYRTLYLNLLMEQQTISSNIVTPLHRFLDAGAVGNWSVLRGATPGTYHHPLLFPFYMKWRYETVIRALDNTTPDSSELYDAMLTILHTDRAMYVKVNDIKSPANGMPDLVMPSYDEWTHTAIPDPLLFEHATFDAYKLAYQEDDQWKTEMAIDRFVFAAAIIHFDIFARHLYRPRARDGDTVNLLQYHGQQLYQTVRYHLVQGLQALPGVSEEDLSRVAPIKPTGFLWLDPNKDPNAGTIDGLKAQLEIFTGTMYSFDMLGYTTTHKSNRTKMRSGATLVNDDGTEVDAMSYIDDRVLGEIRLLLTDASQLRTAWAANTIRTARQDLLIKLTNTVLWNPTSLAAPWPDRTKNDVMLWGWRTRAPWLRDYQLASIAISSMAAPRLLSLLVAFFPNPADSGAAYTMFSIPRIIDVPSDVPGGRRRFFADTEYQPTDALLLGDSQDYYFHDRRAFQDPRANLYNPTPDIVLPADMRDRFEIDRSPSGDPFRRFRPETWRRSTHQTYSTFLNKLSPGLGANMDGVLINVASNILLPLLTGDGADLQLQSIMEQIDLAPVANNTWYFPLQQHPVDVLAINNADLAKKDPAFVSREKIRLNIMGRLNLSPSREKLDAFIKEFSEETGVKAGYFDNDDKKKTQIGSPLLPDTYFKAMADETGLFSMSYFLRELLFIYEEDGGLQQRIAASDKSVKDIEARLHKIQLDQTTSMSTTAGQTMRNLQQDLHTPDPVHMTQDYVSGLLYLSQDALAILDLGLASVESDFGYPDAKLSDLTDVDKKRTLVAAFIGWLAYSQQATGLGHKRTYNTRMDRRQLPTAAIDARTALERELAKQYGSPTWDVQGSSNVQPFVTGNTQMTISIH